MNPETHLFISYSRTDLEWALRLHEDLEASQIPTWIDQYDIRPGADFDNEISRGLATAQAIAVLLTPGSVLSPQVKAEYEFGMNRFIPIIPLLVQRCAVPRMLQPIQQIDFTSSYGAGLAELRRALKNLSQEHLRYLEETRVGLSAAQAESDHPERFQTKIDALTDTIAGWTDRLARQQRRVQVGLVEERKQLAEHARTRRSIAVERIVGQPLQDVSGYFKDRVSALDALGRLVEKDAARVVSVIGRHGIGKTALVSKLLAGLEYNAWPHTTTGPTVDGIVYMSTTVGTGISLEQLFLKCARMFGDTSVESCWTSSTLSLDDKIGYLLSKCRTGLYVVLLDHIDPLLDDSTHLADPQLDRFFELLLAHPNRLRLITTSCQPITSSGPHGAPLRHWYTLPLTDGLPEEQAIEMLREMDAQGSLGLAQASEAMLHEVLDVTGCIPRALELFASLLANDPFLNLDQLRRTFLDSEGVVKQLVEQSYVRLDNSARLVLVALAVFRRPVTTLAVDFMLKESAPGLDVPSILRRLTRTYTVTVNRVTSEIALHPIDREWVYGMHRRQEGEALFPSLVALQRRAAAYYRQQRCSVIERVHIDDIRPEIHEIEHLMAAEDYEQAAVVLDSIDPDCLERWGHYDRAIQMREALDGHLQGLPRMHNLSRLGRLHALRGELESAQRLLEQALGLARELSDRTAESLILGRLGSCAHDLGDSERDRARYEEALGIAQGIDCPLLQALHLYGLGRYYRDRLYVPVATDHFEKCLQTLDGATDPGMRLPEIDPTYLRAHALNNMGLCHRALLALAAANEYYEQALRLMKEIHDRGGTAYAMTNLGSLRRLAGDCESGLKLARDALDVYVEIQDRWGEGNALRIIGGLQGDLGMTEKSLNTLESALRVNEAVHNGKGVGLTLLALSVSNLRDHAIEQSIERGRRALQLFQAVRAVRYESHAAAHLAWACLLRGHFDEGRRLATHAAGADVAETVPSATAALATIAWCKGHRLEAQQAFVDAERRATQALERPDAPYELRYVRALATAGVAITSDAGRASNAVRLYDDAVATCSAPGVLALQRLYLSGLRELPPPLDAVHRVLAPAAE